MSDFQPHDTLRPADLAVAVDGDVVAQTHPPIMWRWDAGARVWKTADGTTERSHIQLAKNGVYAL